MRCYCVGNICDEDTCDFCEFGGFQVQKVSSQNAVFSSLNPGTRFHFVVRTEKESFTDSSPVTINITAGIPTAP